MAIWLTVCVSGVLVLVAKLVVPLKVAVIVWSPTARADVVKVAWPEPSRAIVASTVVPSRNVTVPAVTGLPPPVTVAVNVTA